MLKKLWQVQILSKPWPLDAFLVLPLFILSSPSTHISCGATQGAQSSVTPLKTWLPKAMINPWPHPSRTFDLVDH